VGAEAVKWRLDPRRTAALAAAVLAILWFLWCLLLPTGLTRIVIVDVPRGASVREISMMLRKAGVIRCAFAFHALVRLTGRPLQAGEYGFKRATPWGVMRALQDGRVYLHRVLVREGDAVDQIAAAVAAEKLAPVDQFRRAASDGKMLARLGVRASSAEGYCFPDTYLFPKGMTATQMVGRMVERFRVKVPDGLAAEAAKQGLSRKQWLTLASIVEKEARVAEERPVIAGVYLNRLRKGMRLEADPTVVYAFKHWDSPISLYDLKREHPYNTYKHPGLPPGPISNPGLASLEAAARPAKVPWLFFVARHDGTGRHEFTKTLEEHERAIRDSRKRERDRQQSGK
jgi:UPF0755 protein